MRKIDWFILGLLVISPPFINYVILGISLDTTINGSLDGWLGYYGTLVGSLITMFVLYRTRIWNKEDNEDTRKSQNKILQYHAKQIRLEGLRKQLGLNYRIIDFHQAQIAANNILDGNYQLALKQLTTQLREMEMQGYNFDLYLSGDELDECEKNYINTYVNLMNKFGEFLNDLIIICNIKSRNSQNLNLTSTISSIIKQQKTLNIESNGILLTLAKNLNSEDKLRNICESRFLGFSQLHAEKENLCKATNLLLKSEEKKLKELLT